MSDLALEWPLSRPSAPDDAVHAFLVESEGRVLMHCQKLLDCRDLPGPERDRLVRLSNEAAQELQRLGA